MDQKVICLSHIINKNTPVYGNRSSFLIEKKSSISRGDPANESFINTTVHIGTHIDLPYHFYANGQTIEKFDPSFWIFKKPLFVEIQPGDFVIEAELIAKLSNIENKENYDIIIVKTGIGSKRNDDVFWRENYGFAPGVYDYLRHSFPKIRVFGFDSISVSSFTNRPSGREAHKSFLNPENPILLLEDMNLEEINRSTLLEEVIISPIMISDCDGLPCTVFGFCGFSRNNILQGNK